MSVYYILSIMPDTVVQQRGKHRLEFHGDVYSSKGYKIKYFKC